MSENNTEPTYSKELIETACTRVQLETVGDVGAVSQPQTDQEKLSALFNQGWSYLINQQWQLAEGFFAQVEARNSHYVQDGLLVSTLRQKAKLEQKAEAAWQSGDLEAALQAFKQADDIEHAQEVYELLTIQEREAKAERLTAAADYQAAAWIYDYLLVDFPEHDKETYWQIKKEGCWEAELLPYFNLGLEALEQNKWRTAYQAFTQVVMTDPYFRHDGRFAATFAEEARKEVVLWADQQLRNGEVQKALSAYQEIGHLARIENVDEFLRLRQQEETAAQALEAKEDWYAAAAKYKYLSTLYYDENGRSHWEAAAKRCSENGRLINLYEQGKTAFNNKQWSKAEKLFSQIITIRPNYQQGGQFARKCYRVARWQKFLSYLTTQSGSPPPTVQTSKLS
jgi:tetratricopeptide (TPR) repeat protein